MHEPRTRRTVRMEGERDVREGLHRQVDRRDALVDRTLEDAEVAERCEQSLRYPPKRVLAPVSALSPDDRCDEALCFVGTDMKRAGALSLKQEVADEVVDQLIGSCSVEVQYAVENVRGDARASEDPQGARQLLVVAKALPEDGQDVRNAGARWLPERVLALDAVQVLRERAMLVVDEQERLRVGEQRPGLDDLR